MTRDRLRIESELIKCVHVDHERKIQRFTGLSQLAPEHQTEWREFIAMVYPSFLIEWLD